MAKSQAGTTGRALLLVLVAGLPGLAQEGSLPAPSNPDLRAAVDGAIRKVYPALVRIQVVAAQYGDGREAKVESSGSGVIISNQGHVITNHHVAARARLLRCTLSDKSELSATLVGTDALADIAVLKLDLAGRPAPPVAQFGDSDALQVGDSVLAMGSPLAFSQSVTLGIVSNVEMTFPRLLWPATIKLDGEETGSLVRWIGHDAQIFPGNSGGPLVNLRGEIVGINEISFGLSGAIPGNLAREVAADLMKHGEVRRSWLGVTLQPLLKAEWTTRGVLISSVFPGSPAEAAGLKPGDVLTSYAGQALDVRHPEQLPAVNRLMLTTPVGSRVTLLYERAGKSLASTAVTVARGPAQGEEAEVPFWGATVAELTMMAARGLKREPGSGVIVTSVRPGGAAAEAKPGLQPGDIVVEFAGQPVRRVKDLVERAHAIADGRGAPVPALVSFDRSAQRLLAVLRLGVRDGSDRSAEVTKAWLPVSTQVLTSDLAEALALNGKTGVRLTQVHPGSAAEAAGLKVGDLVLRLDGEPIPASRPEDLEVFSALIRQYRVGSRVRLDLVRDGRPLTVEVELQASPVSTRELVEYRDDTFDFVARDLTVQDRLQPTLDRNLAGVLVTGVETGGWAALAHLAVGDVVLAVDGAPVESRAALATRMKRIAEARPERVVLFVRRGVQTLFLEMEPAWSR